MGAHRAENPRLNAWVALLWASVAAIILIIGGTFAMFVFSGRIVLFPEASQTQTTAPEDEGVLDVTFPVLILNGTPDTGLEQRTRDTLVNVGWSGTDVEAGTSGVTDFPTTTVYYLLEDDEQAALGLANLLGGADIAQSDHYSDPAKPDQRVLTVVLGLDGQAVASTAAG